MKTFKETITTEYIFDSAGNVIKTVVTRESNEDENRKEPMYSPMSGGNSGSNINTLPF